MAGPEKGAAARGQTVLFVDEAGFYLLPAVVRTWAPQGETPLLYEWLTRDHLSAQSAITPDGRLYFRLREDAVDGPAVVDFLRQLLRVIDGKLLIIWDGLPAHRSAAVREFLRTEAHGRVQLERLPGYVPDLNPDEDVWAHLKYVQLRNVATATIDDLAVQIRRAVRRLRRRPSVIEGAFTHVGL